MVIHNSLLIMQFITYNKLDIVCYATVTLHMALIMVSVPKHPDSKAIIGPCQPLDLSLSLSPHPPPSLPPSPSSYSHSQRRDGKSPV